MNNIKNTNKKVLLAVLPYWDPLIPAQGIANLKAFLEEYDYDVTSVDVAVENLFLKLYNEYFDLIREYVPKENHGNFFNIGHDVLRSHMLAHINYDDRQAYLTLVEQAVYLTFYTHLNEEQVLELVKVLDKFYALMETFFLDLVEKEAPQLLGLTVHSGNLAASLFVFRLVRKHYPGIKTVMGGSVFYDHLAKDTPDLDYFMEKTEGVIDKLMIGKGEIFLLKYLKGELPESKRLFTMADFDHSEYTVKGIPDMTDYNLQYYMSLAASTSTGCPYDCSFCNTRSFFGKYKEKELGAVVKQMETIYNNHGHRMYTMLDAILNPVISDFAGRVRKTGLPIYWDAYMKVGDDVADIDNTLNWRRGGLYRTRLGVESGSPHVLKLMNKPITLQQIKDSLSSLAFAGIKTTAYFVIGFPGETEEDFKMTLDLVEEMKDSIFQAECNPFTFHYVGLGKSHEWEGKEKLLFPKEARHMLISQSWLLDCEPSREEQYQRVFRFSRHCETLGIPNPYSMNALQQADERWKRLNRNAVPSVLELLEKSSDIHEKENVKKWVSRKKVEKDDEGDFGF
ncbi:MAG: radical SAM protein [bacterium]|nr:radical SAM protein [bacterium]